MKTADEIAVIPLENEGLDEATVLAVADGRGDQPVLTVVAIDLCRCRRLYCWPFGVPRCKQIVCAGGSRRNQSRDRWLVLINIDLPEVGTRTDNHLHFLLQIFEV